jgi:hypothetical protein
MLILLLVLIYSNIALSLIISKSDLEKCVQTNTTSSLNCTNKLVVTLSVENGKMGDTDYMEAFISEATSDNNLKRLKNPYKITVSKTPVYAEYPVTYVQDFNYRPTEQIIQSDVFSCRDGDLSPDPTCGWVYNNSTIVEYSQGFCCKCDFSQILGIDTTTRSRGSSCSIFNLGSGSATAHCLRFDKLWFSAYEIKKYRINYNIDISITKKEEKNGTEEFVTRSISISPSNSIAKYRDMIAYLVGDFSPPSPPEDYSIYYLTIPTHPHTHPMVREGILNWMLIPKLFFCLDGREFDKIGISYYAFRSHSGCQMRVGDCLKNQIYDFYLSDIKAILGGKRSKYIISQDETKEFVYSNNTNKIFSYKLNGMFNTLITLEIVADNIRYVTNVSVGKIDYMIISNFESISNDGLMETQITNTGDLTAKFYVSFNCTEYILPILSLEIFLSAYETKIIKTSIFNLNSDFRQHMCTCILKDALIEINDKFTVIFNTTKTEQVNTQNPDLSNLEPDNSNKPIVENPTDSIYKDLKCPEVCPEFFGFVCFVAHSCWAFMARTLGVIVLIIALLLILIKFIKNGCCWKMIERILEYFCGGNKENDLERNNSKRAKK